MATVYYSICPYGTANIRTGSPTLTIASGVATFSVAQTGNIGVGCRVTYDSSSKIAYISVMTNSTTATLVTATGGTPADEASAVSCDSIAHEYASIATFEAGFTDANHINNTNLVTATTIVKGPCYYDHDDGTKDTTAVTFGGYTSDATYKVIIYTPEGGTESINSQRHSGAIDANKYQINATLTPTGYLDLIGLQQNTTAQHGYIRASSGAVLFSKHISTGSTAGFPYYHRDGINSTFENSIIYSHSTRGLYTYTSYSGTLTVNNTVITKCDRGIQQEAGTVNVTNCAIFNNTTADWTGTITATYCASDDTKTGTGNIDWDAGATDWNANFTDYTTDDYTVKDTGADIYNSGTATGMPSDDIIGTSRPQGGSYDIGPFEFVVAAGGWDLKGGLSLLGVGL